VTKPRPPGAPPSRRWPLALALLLLRLWAGAFFLDAAVYKLVDGPRAREEASGVEETLGQSFARFRDEEYRPMVQAAVDDPPRVFGAPLTVYADFLRAVMLPGADVFAPTILVAEVLLGVSLVLGLGVRLSAALGFLMMLAFSLAKRVYLLTVQSANWPITLILLALSLAAAGRYVGLDAWVRRRGPRWLRWAS
jgi:uncharacterized membrane protein YphA (DoxX/SURF4 family)